MASPQRDHGYAFIDDSQIASQSQPQPHSQSQSPHNTSRRPASHSHTPHLSPLPLSPSPLSPTSPTSYTLSTKRQHHQVRIQGRLMLVKSVSANAVNAAGPASLGAREDDAVDAHNNTNKDAEYTNYTNKTETELRDQRRGYGIGGAGNIRRPTEVLHFYSTSNRTVADDGPRKRRWQWMNSLLGRKERSSYSYEKY